MARIRQHTIRYKTLLKQSVVEALEAVFKDHPDKLLKDTKVRLQSSFKEVDYPTVVLNYHEQDVSDAGVGHYEKAQDAASGLWYRRRRKHYHGTLEFTISALSTLDRDIISDAMVEAMMMPDIHAYTDFFLSRIYRQEEFERLKNMPAGSLGTAHYFHFINLGNQRLTGSGESAVPNPWGAEDVLLYQTSYSMPVFGEVLSLPPTILYNLLEEVRSYPYVGGIEPVPTGTVDPALWLSESST